MQRNSLNFILKQFESDCLLGKTDSSIDFNLFQLKLTYRFHWHFLGLTRLEMESESNFFFFWKKITN